MKEFRQVYEPHGGASQRQFHINGSLLVAMDIKDKDDQFYKAVRYGIY